AESRHPLIFLLIGSAEFYDRSQPCCDRFLSRNRRAVRSRRETSTSLRAIPLNAWSAKHFPTARLPHSGDISLPTPRTARAEQVPNALPISMSRSPHQQSHSRDSGHGHQSIPKTPLPESALESAKLDLETW